MWPRTLVFLADDIDRGPPGVLKPVIRPVDPCRGSGFAAWKTAGPESASASEAVKSGSFFMRAGPDIL